MLCQNVDFQIGISFVFLAARVAGKFLGRSPGVDITKMLSHRPLTVECLKDFNKLLG
jgi:hypothetical protein